ELIRSSDAHDLVDSPGGVFVRKATAVADEDKVLLQAAARVVLEGAQGLLASQLDGVERLPAHPPALVPAQGSASWTSDEPRSASDLQFWNGVGGFTSDGREYQVTIRSTNRSNVRRNGAPEPRAVPHLALPPAPWINVIANPSAGFLVSESGSGYTWVG